MLNGISQTALPTVLRLEFGFCFRDIYACIFIVVMSALLIEQDSYGDTPLHDAIAKDFQHIIEIITSVPSIDFTLQNNRGFNLLHHAALKGNKL